MRGPLLILAVLLLPAVAVRAGEEPPPTAPKARDEKQDRETLRTELLAAYRRQERFSLLYEYVRDHAAGRKDVKPLAFVGLYTDSRRTLLHVFSTKHATQRVNVAYMLSAKRFVIQVEGRGRSLIGRGLAFPQARTDRVNREIERLGTARSAGIAPLDPWFCQIDLGLEIDEQGNPSADIALGAVTGERHTPSWLAKAFWAAHTLGDATESRVHLRSKRRHRSVERSRGLLVRERLASPDGKTASRLLRGKPLKNPTTWHKLADRYEKARRNDRGRSLDAVGRHLTLQLLLQRLAKVRRGNAPAWLLAAAPRFVRAVYEDELADEELERICRWGKTQLAAAQRRETRASVAKLRGFVLVDMQDRLLDRWWGPVEKTLRAKAGEDGTPASGSALVQAFCKAVRAYGNERVAQAWVD